MTGDPTECPLLSTPVAAAHLLGASAGKARQTRRSLLGCVHGNIALWSGSGRGCFVYPALVRRSLNGTHRRTSTALFFGGPTPFLLAPSKEMGAGKTFFKDAVLDRPEAPLGASDVFSAFRESRAYHLVPSSQATRRTKPPSAISQRHRRRPAAVKIAAGDLRRAYSFRPSMGEERIPLRCESARDPYHLVPSSQATRRTKPPSAISQRKGKAAMVIRRPVTSSISPPAFSTVHTPLCM